MNPSFIAYLFLFVFSFPGSGMHTLSPPRQNKICLLKTLMQTVIRTFLYLSYLLINKINWYLLTREIDATCKNSNS